MEEENNIPQFTAADIKNYWAGKLNAAEMHALEKAAMEDAFLADALEGYQYAAKSDDDTAILHHKLAERVGAGAPVININRKKYGWLKIAAAVIFIGGLGILVQQTIFKSETHNLVSRSPLEDRKEKTIEQKASEPSETVVIAPDTSSNQTIVGKGKKVTTIATDTFSNNAVVGNVATFSLTITDTSKKEQGNAEVVQAQGAYVKPELKTAPVASVKESEALYKKAGETRRKALDSMRTDNVSNLYVRADSVTGVFRDADNITTYGSVAQKPKVTDTRKWADDKAGRGNNNYGFYYSNKYSYRVVDAQNRPVPFANVMNTRDNVGTYTDIRGNFNLVSADSTMEVQIKSLGYNSANYRLVPSNQSGDLVLKEDDEARKQILAQNRKVVSSIVRKDSAELEEPEVGWNNYNTYVANNIQIPENLRAKNESNDVELSFDIDKNGNPVNIKVTKSSQCKACDDEAIRLLKDGPKWKRKGKKNKTTITIAVDQR